MEPKQKSEPSASPAARTPAAVLAPRAPREPGFRRDLTVSLEGFHPVSLQAHTSAPLLVSIQELDVEIITRRVACSDFRDFDLEPSSS